MDSWALWVGIPLLVVLAAAAAGYVWFRNDDAVVWPFGGSTSGSRGAKHEPLTPEQQAQQEKIAELRAEVKAAKENLQKTTRAQKREEYRGQRMLASAARARTERLLSFHGQDGFVYLAPTEIRVREGTFPVTPTLTAEAGIGGDIVVKRRSTLTRIAAGGMLAGPIGALVGAAAQKTTYEDKRQIFMLIEGEQFVSLLVVRPKQARAAVNAVAKIRQAALSFEEFQSDNHRKTIAGKQTLIRANKQAKNVLAAQRNVRAAEQSLAEAEADLGPISWSSGTQLPRPPLACSCTPPRQLGRPRS